MIKSHRDRTRRPESKAAAKARRAARVQLERVATNAERAYVRMLEGTVTR